MSEVREKFTVSYRSPQYAERRRATFRDCNTARRYAQEKQTEGRTHIRIDAERVEVTKWRVRVDRGGY